MFVFKRPIPLRLILTSFLIVLVQLLYAQKKDSAQLRLDSLRNLSKDNKADTSVSSLLKKTESVTHILNNIKSVLSRGFDTADIAEDLPELENKLEKFRVNFIENQRILSLRNLKLIKIVSTNYNIQLKKWQETLFGYSSEISNINNDLDKIVQDSSSIFLSSDSALGQNYLKQIQSFARKWKRADSSNKVSLQKINSLQNRVANAFIANSELLDETNYRIENFTKNILRPEERSIFHFSATDYKEDFSVIIFRSFKIAIEIIGFYVVNNEGSLGLYLFFIIALALWFWNNNNRLIKRKKDDSLNRFTATNITKHPALTSILILSIFAPIFFEDVPVSFTILFWFTLALVYTSVFIQQPVIHYKKEWVALVTLFLIINSCNILTKSSYLERWLYLMLTICSLVLGIILYRKILSNKSHILYSAKYIILLFIVLNALSLVANSLGCFLLSKYISSAAISAVLTARILYTIGELIIEAIYLQYEVYKDNNLIISYFDYHRLQSKIHKIINVFVTVIWVVILMRNLNFFDPVYNTLSEILSDERTLGNMQFTFGSIFIFITVIWVSNFISKTLLLIFGNDSAVSSNKKKWGSTLLLTRLGILALGVLLAFAASGIPMDKLTIIIGALGVGIGFGLQNIVNNLVSGIILAFEKPVQVGDAIEVGNRYGTVKEIGIRSSRLLTADGSEVIVPNGDLISQQIVNWTLSNHFRRVEIIVGVSYDSDLRKVEHLLKEILQTQNGIEKLPAPNVLAHFFGNSSVDFRLLFWCNIDIWVTVKSDILIAVYDCFRENGIQIPFPQTDVHIKTDK